MRMWNIKPESMCRKHLLGEHVEMHMFVGTIKRGKSIQGYLDNQLVETGKIKKRHNALVKEMLKRGYNHNSPLNDEFIEAGYADAEANEVELLRRCSDCRSLLKC